MNPPNGTPTSEQFQIIEHLECRLCYQPIDARASRCPFCHAPQRPPSRLAQRLRQAGVSVLILALAGAVVWLAAARNQLAAERHRLQSELGSVEQRIEMSAPLPVPPSARARDPALLLEQWQDDAARELCRTAADTPPCHRLIGAIEYQVPAYLAATRQATERSWDLCSSGRRVLCRAAGISNDSDPSEPPPAASRLNKLLDTAPQILYIYTFF